MSKRQARNAAFYSLRRQRRIVRRIIRENQDKPGFLGAATHMTITTPSGERMQLKAGALFLGVRK